MFTMCDNAAAAAAERKKIHKLLAAGTYAKPPTQSLARSLSRSLLLFLPHVMTVIRPLCHSSRHDADANGDVAALALFFCACRKVMFFLLLFIYAFFFLFTLLYMYMYVVTPSCSHLTL